MEYNYQSQDWTAQDKFVAESLKFLKNGFFLDIGCHDYKNISNTYFLEKQLNWKGIAIDKDCNFKENWQIHRPNSVFICGDAITMDYQTLLHSNNAPKNIDYLSIDVDPGPPYSNFLILKNIMNNDYIFKTITIETEQHLGDMQTRDESRALLIQKGYKLANSIVQDDFWVHPSILTN